MKLDEIADRIENRWLAPMPARRLGLLRAAIGGYGLWYVWTRQDIIFGFADSSRSLYEPVGVFRLVPYPIGEVAVQWMVIATIVTGVLFVLGLAFRYAGPAFGVLLLATLCYRNSWSMIYHMHNTLALHVLVLGFCRAADGFSFDALLARQSTDPEQQEDWIYGWPVRLICGVTAVSYFLAGFAKLIGPEGLYWASGESLRAQIAVDTIRKEVLESGGMELAFVLFDQVWLFTLMGVGTFIIELGAPWFALNRRSGMAWALLAFSMHWGIYLIMGIKFRYHLSFIIFLPFFPVEKWLGLVWRTSKISSTAPNPQMIANHQS